MRRYSPEEEKDRLDLVCAAQAELRCGLNSLGGRQVVGPVDKFFTSLASSLCKAADGFILLRQSGCIGGSKFLVRPIIEMCIRMNAVHENPSLLYQLAFAERRASNLWRRLAMERQGRVFDESADSEAWKEFREASVAHFSEAQLSEEKINLKQVAGESLKNYYDSHYRLYSTYTHGEFAAAAGELDEITNREDCLTVATCTVRSMVILETIGASCPHLRECDDRLVDLLNRSDE